VFAEPWRRRKEEEEELKRGGASKEKRNEKVDPGTKWKNAQDYYYYCTVSVCERV
jgi:hypothetical protein